MPKITTEFLRKEMKTWFADNRAYFENCYDGQPEAKQIADDAVNGKWLRETKSRVGNSDWVETEDLEAYLEEEGLNGGADVEYFNKAYVSGNKINAANCWYRCFTDPGEYTDWRLEVYTDPSDNHIVLWTIIGD